MRRRERLGIRILLAAMVGLAFAAQHARAETGAGNGTEGSRAATRAALGRELGRTRCSAKSCGATQLTAWCGRVTQVVERQLKAAQKKISRSRLEEAKGILVDALELASESLELDPEMAHPLTKLMIDRGLRLNQALDERDRRDGRGAGDRGGLVSRLNYLIEYVELILEQERELDRPYYIPYQYQYGRSCGTRCPASFMQAIELRYVAYAKAQLEFVASARFADQVGDVALPVGQAGHFLVAAELFSSFTADDLEPNLFGSIFSCEIGDLRSLADTLGAYNWLGDRSIYERDPEAMNDTFHELTRVSSHLASCRR